MTFAKYLADSDMVPKDFKGKPANCLIAIQWGAELGLKPLQAIQNIAVINGRPALWGDSVIALVRSSPLCEWIVENDDGTAAMCRVKRRGEPEQSRSFSMEDARIAGLVGKAGPWTQYPQRMRQMRARAFALRDVFPDVLKGLPVAEELMDIPTDTPRADPPPPQTPVVAEWPADRFASLLPEWRAAIANGKATAASIIRKASLKWPLNAQQIEAINAPIPPADSVTDVAPRRTFESVADQIAAARTLEDLDAALNAIPDVPAASDRAELDDRIETARAAMGAAS